MLDLIEKIIVTDMAMNIGAVKEMWILIYKISLLIISLLYKKLQKNRNYNNN